MTSIEQKIQDAAARNSTLLTGLYETDSAPSQLYQQIQYIADLEPQITQTSKECTVLKQKTNSELQDHKKYSESTFRRFAHKASGRKERFAEKAAKEEREYFEAIQEQKSAEDKLAYLQQLKAEAEIAKDKYEIEAQKHDQYQQELDALYNSIFAGHTPGFPEEDQREQECAAANQHVQELHRTLEHERHLLFLLRQTSGKLSETRVHLDSAHDLSTWDMFGGGNMSSMMKRNYLEKAESALAQVRMLQEQIRYINPHLADLGSMSIASGSIWTDVVFDNIFTDMDMHDKIKNSEMEVDRAGNKCGESVKVQEGREKEVLAEIRDANEQLNEARLRLQRAREDAFRKVNGGEAIPGGESTITPGGSHATTSDAPPAYSV